jgi:hypothetical protein
MIPDRETIGTERAVADASGQHVAVNRQRYASTTNQILDAVTVVYFWRLYLACVRRTVHPLWIQLVVIA